VSIFKRFLKFLVGLFSPSTANKIYAGLEAISPYLPRATSVVMQLAGLTPARTVTQFAEAAAFFGVEIAEQLALKKESGEILAHIAGEAMRKYFPEAANRHIKRALEIAYGAVKE